MILVMLAINQWLDTWVVVREANPIHQLLPRGFGMENFIPVAPGVPRGQNDNNTIHFTKRCNSVEQKHFRHEHYY